jgi:phosphoenolpyruvate-protein phosphotransferase (PTS system enzyme I)
MARERIALRGIAASPGVGVGRAVVIGAERHHVRHSRIAAGEVSFEIERLRDAIERSRRELEDIRQRLGEEAPADYRLILEAHMMMHRDQLLEDMATEAILHELLNAEWAIETAVGKIGHHLQQSPVDYFRDRAVDVEHVGRRIIAQLAGRVSSLPPGLAESVLVIHDLQPADAAQLIQTPVAALVTGLGTATSHTAILARALAIPAVVGVADITERVGDEDDLIVDAFGGEVVLDPDPDECDRARLRSRRFGRFRDKLRESSAMHAQLADGSDVELMANVDLPTEAAMAAEMQAKGIGLYRTEFLFLSRPEPPTEQEQYEVYREIVRATAPNAVTVRTIDMGGEALKGLPNVPLMPNPALGLRAIRLALARPELLGAQLRAVLRAAAEGPLKLMFPLVSGIKELRQARAALERARAELERRGETFGALEVGVMIELPSAVMMADRFAVECDFLSVGTTDLVQYGLAVDRSNPAVAYLSQPLDPAVLRMLDAVVRAASAGAKPLSMCGDMAANPFVLPVVLGLGYRRLSVPVSTLPLVREVLRRVDATEAAALAASALECATADEVSELIRSRFTAVLGELWAEAGIDAP